jgi:hypothetical protein
MLKTTQSLDFVHLAVLNITTETQLLGARLAEAHSTGNILLCVRCIVSCRALHREVVFKL